MRGDFNNRTSILAAIVAAAGAGAAADDDDDDDDGKDASILTFATCNGGCCSLCSCLIVFGGECSNQHVFAFSINDVISSNKGGMTTLNPPKNAALLAVVSDNTMA